MNIIINKIKLGENSSRLVRIMINKSLEEYKQQVNRLSLVIEKGINELVTPEMIKDFKKLGFPISTDSPELFSLYYTDRFFFNNINGSLSKYYLLFIDEEDYNGSNTIQVEYLLSKVSKNTRDIITYEGEKAIRLMNKFHDLRSELTGLLTPDKDLKELEIYYPEIYEVYINQIYKPKYIEEINELREIEKKIKETI